MLVQVCPSLEKAKSAAEAISLVEVGPRACLNPILIFSGAFGGAHARLCHVPCGSPEIDRFQMCYLLSQDVCDCSC